MAASVSFLCKYWGKIELETVELLKNVPSQTIDDEFLKTTTDRIILVRSWFEAQRKFNITNDSTDRLQYFQSNEGSIFNQTVYDQYSQSIGLFTDHRISGNRLDLTDKTIFCDGNYSSLIDAKIIEKKNVLMTACTKQTSHSNGAEQSLDNVLELDVSAVKLDENLITVENEKSMPDCNSTMIVTTAAFNSSSLDIRTSTFEGVEPSAIYSTEIDKSSTIAKLNGTVNSLSGNLTTVESAESTKHQTVTNEVNPEIDFAAKTTSNESVIQLLADGSGENDSSMANNGSIIVADKINNSSIIQASTGDNEKSTEKRTNSIDLRPRIYLDHLNDEYVTRIIEAERRRIENLSHTNEQQRENEPLDEASARNVAKKRKLVIDLDEKIQFVCRFCMFSSPSENLVRRHERIHLKKHMRTHANESTLVRPIRPRELSQKRSRMMEPKQKLECDHCSYVTYWKSRFEQHMRTHSGDEDKQIRCERCQKCFTRNSILIRHTKRSCKPSLVLRFIEVGKGKYFAVNRRSY